MYVHGCCCCCCYNCVYCQVRVSNDDDDDVGRYYLFWWLFDFIRMNEISEIKYFFHIFTAIFFVVVIFFL